MFDRFEDDAKRAMNEARKEAQRLGQGFLDAEHILLGLLQLSTCTAVRVLESLGLEVAAIRARVLERVSLVEKRDSQMLPFTDRSKRVLERAMDQAGKLGDHYIGTEHLLLGYALIEEPYPPAARLLGVDAERLLSALPKVTRGGNASPRPNAEGSIAEKLAHHVRALEEIKEALVHEKRFEQAARLRNLASEIKSLANEISRPPS